MISSILDLDTQTNQYYYDSGYSDTPSPGGSSTSSRVISSPISNISDDNIPHNLRYLKLSDDYSDSSFCVYRLNQIQPQIFQNQGDKPELVIIEQPVDKFRFRYKSEMHGTHGSLMGKNNEKSKRTYPTVELKNYYGEAIIRCSLYQTNTLKRLPHSHKLVVRNGDDDQCDPHDLRVSPDIGFRAVFQGMGIIHTAKRYIVDELIEKKIKEKRFEVGGRNLSVREESQIKISAEKEAKEMNLNQVCLAFHAYAVNGDGTLSKLCEPVFSNPINNMKSALTGELKIVRLSSFVSSAAGGEDLFLLVEKVGKKNIKVRFFELNGDDEEIWQDWGSFNEADVHHQYAIALKTPPYKDKDIECQVDVYIQLLRPSDGAISEPVPFRYKPKDFVSSRKRPRTISFSSSSSIDLPESICYDNNKDAYNHDQLTISEEFNKSGEIDKLLAESVPDEFIYSVQKDSGELFKYMDDILDSAEVNKLLTDGVSNYKSSKIMTTKTTTTITKQDNKLKISEQQQQLKQKFIENPTDRNWFSTYIQRILKTLRSNIKSDMKLDCKKAREEIKNIFYEAYIKYNDLLHYGIEQGNKTVPKLLSYIKELDIPEVLHYQNEDRQTCLHVACTYDRPEYIRVLLHLGVSPNSPNKNGDTPLHIAVQNGFIICVSKILEKSNYQENNEKLVINLANNDGFTALHLAIRNKNLPIIKKLIKDGEASVKVADKKDGNNPLHLAVQTKDEEIIKYLLEQTSVNISQQNLRGLTPVHIALNLGPDGKSILRLLHTYSKSKGVSSPLISMDSPAATEESSSSDDDDYDSMRIDEMKAMFDSHCITELSSIFNVNDKWKLLADKLDLNSHICLWISGDNPTEKMLNHINNYENDKTMLDRIINACGELKETDAVSCIRKMIKRQK